VAGGWRRLRDEALHNLYTSLNIVRVITSRRMGWTVHVARMRKMRNSCKILVGKREGKRLLGRPRRRRENNFRMDLREIGWESVEWMHVAQFRNQ